MACTTQPEGCGSGHSETSTENATIKAIWMCYRILLITVPNQLFQIWIQIQAEALNPLNCKFKNGMKMGDSLFYGCMMIPSVVKYPKVLAGSLI